MLLNLSDDPSLGEFQLAFEQQYVNRRSVFRTYAQGTELLLEFFNRERKPRDVFRDDAKAYEIWLKKKGYSDRSTGLYIQVARSYFRFIKELGVGEDDGYNPFERVGPRRIRVTPRH